jgi:serine/threonine protein kinase
MKGYNKVSLSVALAFYITSVHAAVAILSTYDASLDKSHSPPDVEEATEPAMLVRSAKRHSGQKQAFIRNDDKILKTEVGPAGEVTFEAPDEGLSTDKVSQDEIASTNATPRLVRPAHTVVSSSGDVRPGRSNNDVRLVRVSESPTQSVIQVGLNHSTHEGEQQLSRGTSVVIVVLVTLIIFVWGSLIALLIGFKKQNGEDLISNPLLGDDRGESSQLDVSDHEVNVGRSEALAQSRLDGTGSASLKPLSVSRKGTGEGLLENLKEDASDFMKACSQSFALGDMSMMFGSMSPDVNDNFLDYYEVHEKLGDGSFGVVYGVTEIETGKELAVKMIDLAHSDYDDVMMEVRMLRRVRHPHLTVSCIDEYQDSCFYYIVMPKYSGGDLIESLTAHIEEHGLLSERIFVRCFEQMCAAVEFVHGKSVVHRDIKPDNFLTSRFDITDPKNEVVLTDFGLSVVLKEGQPDLTDQSGTEMFWCPEMLGSDCKYRFGCDVFALGITAYMLLAGKHPFGSLRGLEEWANSDSPMPQPPASEATQEMMELALDRDPGDRATVAQLYALVCGHPLLKSSDTDVQEASNLQHKISATAKTAALKFLRCGQGNVDEARIQRRQAMMNHLKQDHHKQKVKAGGDTLGLTTVQNARPKSEGEDAKRRMFDYKPFRMAGGGREFVHYDWWSPEKCESEGIKTMVNIEENFGRRRSFTKDNSNESARSDDVAYLTAIMSEFGVDWVKQWRNPFSAMENLALECRRGESMLAVEEKKLIRLVELVVPILTASSGAVLVTEEVPKDKQGATETETILPGKKRRPWENRNQTVVRMLQSLGIAEKHIVFTSDRHCFIQKQESKSFPGILTVYRRHVIYVTFNMDVVTDDLLKQKGWPKGEQFVEEQAAGKPAKIWTWISKESFASLALADNQGDPDLAARYSACVPARTHDQGHKQEGGKLQALFNQLKRCGIPANTWDTEQLECLMAEEETGECSLIEQDSGGKKSLKRVVRLTVIRVINEDGSFLVESGNENRGKVKDGKRMPAIKQRCHENPFNAARRFLTSRLNLEDDEVCFDPDAGGNVSETGDSKSFPGLISVYEKHIVEVRLDEKEELPQPSVQCSSLTVVDPEGATSRKVNFAGPSSSENDALLTQDSEDIDSEGGSPV